MSRYLISFSVVVASLMMCGAAWADDKPATTSTSQPTISITGKITDESGKPIADAPVNIGPPRKDGKLPPYTATATSDKDGNYELKWDPSKAPDGDYVVRCYMGRKGAWLEMKIKDGKPVPAEVNLVLKPLPANS